MGRYDPFEFCGQLKRETDMAYLVTDGEKTVWLPKSQIQDINEINKYHGTYEFIIPEWLAIEKGIV